MLGFLRVLDLGNGHGSEKSLGTRTGMCLWERDWKTGTNQVGAITRGVISPPKGLIGEARDMEMIVLETIAIGADMTGRGTCTWMIGEEIRTGMITTSLDKSGVKGITAMGTGTMVEIIVIGMGGGGSAMLQMRTRGMARGIGRIATTGIGTTVSATGTTSPMVTDVNVIGTTIIGGPGRTNVHPAVNNLSRTTALPSPPLSHL